MKTETEETKAADAWKKFRGLGTIKLATPTPVLDSAWIRKVLGFKKSNVLRGGGA